MAGKRPRLDADRARGELEAVTTFLRPRREGATLHDIIRGTHLPVTVVVPLLDVLVADGVVDRRWVPGAAGTPMSMFVLTSAGRRGARRGEARSGEASS